MGIIRYLRLAALPHALAVALAAAGAVYVSRADAGVADWSIVVGIASATPLAVVAKAWRLPAWLLAASAALPVSIIVVALADGSFHDATRAARYGYGALLFVGIIAWAQTPLRRKIAAAIASLIVLDQFTVAWYPWWGSGDPHHLMFGTFYWHNQFGAFCAAGAAVAIALAGFARRTWALVGGVVLAFATTGVLASGSRAALVMLAGAFLAGLAALVISSRWRGALRWVVLLAASAGVAALMFSPLLFPGEAASPLGTVTERSANGTFESSGVTRVGFWIAGLQVGAEHPLTGGGLGTYGLRSQCFPLTYYSSNPHNEWVLAWAEGGLVGVVPLLAVLAGVIWLVVRSVPRATRPGAFAADPGRWGALVALVLLVAHAAVDFDWSWGLLTGLVGVVAGIAAAPFATRRIHSAPSRKHVIAGSLLIALLVVAAVTGRVIDPQPHDPLLAGPVQSTIVDYCAR